MGTTSIVLAMIEDGALDHIDLMPRKPVSEMHAVSHDTTLRHRIALADGRRLTAIEIQAQICDLARAYCEERASGAIDEQTLDVLDRWSTTLEDLAADPMTCANRIDWVAKLALLEEYRARDGLDWSAHRLQAIDLQYSDVRHDKGLASRLEARGRLDRLFTDAEVVRAMSAPPDDTRAYFRGECLRRYPDQVAAASWDSVVFDVPGHESLLRVPTLEPLRGTREHVGALLDASPTPEVLLAALSVSS